ncbi:hypothetical protein BJ508DRAFT_329798 [Ascobolus immersus RN42]|uniref:Uncharacterized protein n=1 Tax=Ascobolus immersus RN42 TaxID=1160509 RepID=A0A3N4HVM1_ASCIM|nr:hypothetical protein BJ508DRAFT_329798 [Ascobolus immersus RN42]
MSRVFETIFRAIKKLIDRSVRIPVRKFARKYSQSQRQRPRSKLESYRFPFIYAHELSRGSKIVKPKKGGAAYCFRISPAEFAKFKKRVRDQNLRRTRRFKIEYYPAASALHIMPIHETHGSAASIFGHMCAMWFELNIEGSINSPFFPGQFADRSIRLYNPDDPDFEGKPQREADLSFGTMRHKTNKKYSAVMEVGNSQDFADVQARCHEWICWTKGIVNIALGLSVTYDLRGDIRIAAWETVSTSGRDRRDPPSPVPNDNKVTVGRKLFDYTLVDKLAKDSKVNPTDLIARKRSDCPEYIKIPLKYFVDIKNEKARCERAGWPVCPSSVRDMEVSIEVDSFLTRLGNSVRDSRISQESKASSSKDYGHELPKPYKPSKSTKVKKRRGFLLETRSPFRSRSNATSQEGNSDDDDNYVDNSKSKTGGMLSAMTRMLTRSRSKLGLGRNDERG